MAKGAVPGWRHWFHRCRFGHQLSRQGRRRGTLMRHFLLPSPVLTLTFGVGTAAAMRVLIATASGSYRLMACLWRTSPRAIAVAAITVAADQHGGAAAGTKVAPSWEFHWQLGPMGSRRRRALREILCRQRRRCWGCGARHRNWLGGWDRCRACVSTGWSAFYRIGDLSATDHPYRSTSAALRLPDDDCFAIRSPGALRAANRKTSIFMPDRQKPKSPQRLASSVRGRQFSTWTEHR